MSTRGPSIACIGVIGRTNEPLHIALFPAHDNDPPRDRLEFSYLLSSCLDMFEARLMVKTIGQDLGLLQAIDDRLAMYGWLTNTGIKFVIVVDMQGRAIEKDGKNHLMGLRSTDVPPAFRALQTAHVNLLRNPFYDPDESSASNGRLKSTEIKSKQFIEAVDRIGRTWIPGT